MSKTNACRILDSLGIPYELREYDVDLDDLSAENVAAKVHFPPEQVFKTLAVKGDRNGVAVAVIPGNYELNFKALAQLTADRKVEMLPLKEVQSVTGYIRGGVTALGMKKDYPVFADETIELWNLVCLSAGQRGLQIVIAPADYLRATGATVAEISRQKP
jgi:Cys-tRNA(Pro)/Cys-tRNA(Cys) deacylase